MEGPFLGNAALASGVLTRYQLRRYYRPVMPNVYLDKQIEPSLRQRTVAAHLWSGGQAVVAGLAASAIHGSKWIDDDSVVELIWRNARPPKGVVTRDDLLLIGEVQRYDDIRVTNPTRTAFDLGRRGRLDAAVTRLDALAAATRLEPRAVLDLAAEHRHARGLRRLEVALDLMDPGAESPKETWLRLLVIRAGYPRPRTQLRVPKPDGSGNYYLDMGWEDIMLALEYDGGQHWDNSKRIAYDIKRAEFLREIGWNVVQVMKEHHRIDILNLLRRAWTTATR